MSESSAESVEIAKGKDITIFFHAKRCIHARFCVLGAPSVFKANTIGEWIYPDNMDVDKLVAVAENCPSGAVQYERHDGKPNEVPPPVNLLNVREKGPNALRGQLQLKGEDLGTTRATLCRCGMSKNKPFCDNSHIESHFQATGEPAITEITSLPVRDGVLNINPLPNGPNEVTGNLELCQGTGHTFAKTTSVHLCRCGHSGNKPFCDGSHAKVGFIAP